MSQWTPCEESKHCYYEEFHRDRKYCRILNDKDGNPPYPDGKCMFFKSKESDFSGGQYARSCEENAGEAAGS